LWIPYAEVTYLNRLDLRIAAVCIGAALTILWALVPRVDRFDPPGPRLSESADPKLFQVIRDVAAETKQTLPADVYLINDVNAWVAHRGGTMGFGSHRVMGVGLPLLQAMSVSEFRAIIAHEFGHYWSGDVKLGPWIYKTRAAIARTIAGVHQTFVEAPFQWYGRQFLKLTYAVSRQQEFIADQVAARVAGAPTVASALRRVTAVAPLYSFYVRDDVVPVLEAGFLPPLANGFTEFLKTGRIADASQRIVGAAEDSGETDLFDTHPSLRDRLAALGDGPEMTSRGDDSADSASTLLDNPDAQARALLEFAIGRENIRKLKPIDWAVVGESVFANRWREIARSQSSWLGQFTADSVPIGKHAFIRHGSELVRRDEPYVGSDERIARAALVLGVGVSVLLLDDGWQARTAPGNPVLLVRGSQVFDPFSEVRALAGGLLSEEAWKAKCHALGIAGKPLGHGSAIEGVSVPATSGALSAVSAVTRSVAVPPIAGRSLNEPPRRVEIDQVNCWRCKHPLVLTTDNRGKTVKCSQCGTKQRLPL
jgi:heat shock protein HtpX